MIFAFHGYPAILHKLTYRRRNHDNIHVRGYKEEGTTTTPSLVQRGVSLSETRVSTQE